MAVGSRLCILIYSKALTPTLHASSYLSSHLTRGVNLAVYAWHVNIDYLKRWFAHEESERTTHENEFLLSEGTESRNSLFPVFLSPSLALARLSDISLSLPNLLRTVSDGGELHFPPARVVFRPA